MQHVVSNLLFFFQMLKFRLFIFYRRHPNLSSQGGSQTFYDRARVGYWFAGKWIDNREKVWTKIFLGSFYSSRERLYLSNSIFSEIREKPYILNSLPWHRSSEGE